MKKTFMRVGAALFALALFVLASGAERLDAVAPDAGDKPAAAKKKNGLAKKTPVDPEIKSGSLELYCGSEVGIRPTGGFRCAKVALTETRLCPVKVKITCTSMDTIGIRPARHDSIVVQPPVGGRQVRARTLCCNAGNMETLSRVDFSCLSGEGRPDCAFSYELSP